MPNSTNLQDISGIETIKLGFFQELQRKISELKGSNIKLEQKRQDVQAILDGIPDVMAVVATDFRVLTVNKSFYAVYPGVEPAGQCCHEVFKGQAAPCSPCPIAMALENNTQVSRVLQILNWHGEKRQVECTASVMRNAGDKQPRVLLLQRDVTLERQFQAKYFQAERMATIGVLAEGVAHEINNPLTSIGGFAEALVRRLAELENVLPEDKRGPVFEVFSEYLSTILKECNRCSGIVRNLLTFGHREVMHFPVNINSVVLNTIKLLNPRLDRLPSGIICLNLDSRDPTVQGHPGELMQVVLNLVLNALYAVLQKGTITIDTERRENMVLLRVSDTGSGIQEEHLNKLFEPFFTTKPPGQGIGIGLSTCYNIIRKHGGDITVESEFGKGSVFEVVLPNLCESE